MRATLPDSCQFRSSVYQVPQSIPFFSTSEVSKQQQRSVRQIDIDPVRRRASNAGEEKKNVRKIYLLCEDQPNIIIIVLMNSVSDSREQQQQLQQ